MNKLPFSPFLFWRCLFRLTFIMDYHREYFREHFRKEKKSGMALENVFFLLMTQIIKQASRLRRWKQKLSIEIVMCMNEISRTQTFCLCLQYWWIFFLWRRKENQATRKCQTLKVSSQREENSREENNWDIFVNVNIHEFPGSC